MLKKSIILLFVLSIPCTATAAFADFVATNLGYIRPHVEVLHMLLLGIGLFALASSLRGWLKDADQAR